MDSIDNVPSQAMQLNAQELEVISDPSLVFDTSVAESLNVIYGRLLTGKVINKVGLKNLFDSLWQNKLSVVIEDYADGIIKLTFESDGGKNRILKGQPWHFAGSYLIFVEAEATMQITPELFQQIPFWVQVHGLPPGHLLKPHGEKLGKLIPNSIGEFMEYDQEERSNFMRFQVRIDSSRPLVRGKFLNLNKNKGNIWVRFRYERLSKYCYYCGLLDHIQKGCVLLAEEIESGRKPTLQYDDSIKTTGLVHGLSTNAISTSAGRNVITKSIVQLGWNVDQNVFDDSLNDRNTKRVRTENLSQGKIIMILKGDAKEKMEDGQIIIQKEEGNSRNLSNVAKGYSKGGKGSTNQIVQNGGQEEATKK